MNPKLFDPRAWSRSLAREAPRQKFDATDLPSARRWQKKTRAQFIKLLGGLPVEHPPLKPRMLSREEHSDHTRETLHFQSRDGLRVFAYFLLPKGVAAPLPAMLCLHGHGYGVDSLVGLDAFGKPLKTAEYHHAFALQAVRNGYATLAIEILGFGRRREGIGDGAFEAGSGASSCSTLSGNALMLGQSIAGWRVYDAMRAMDYLETRPEVDAKRIGNMGISGGGLNVLFHAAVDERVRACVVSGYFNTFRQSVMQINHCIDNFVPGLASELEMSDLAALVAPRAMWCESGSQDSIFPVKSFRSALREAKRNYDVFGAGEQIGGEVFHGDHQFYGKGTWKFLDEHLNGTKI